jgi:hypothetical protein
MRGHILYAPTSAGRKYPIFKAVNTKIGTADPVFLILSAKPAYPLLSGSLGPPVISIRVKKFSYPKTGSRPSDRRNVFIDSPARPLYYAGIQRKMSGGLLRPINLAAQEEG